MKGVSGEICNWRSCVEAAVNYSVSSGREVQAMVQKVPRLRSDPQGCQWLIEDPFSILFMILLGTWQAGTILKSYVF